MSEISIALPELRILLIDADRAFHALLQAAAKALPGAQILSCAAPGEALNRMDKFIPALFIIDGRIGGAAGINFVRRVRAGQTPAPAGTLVMFAAQDFSGGLSGKLVDVGCHAIVRKPLSPDALTRAIVRVFESPVPFVMGGQYLGPERRKPDATAKPDPERRRTPTRGGYSTTPRLPRDAMPMVSLAAPLGAKPAAKSGGIKTGAPPGGGIEALAAPEPKQKGPVAPLDDAPAPAAAKQKQSLVDDAATPAKQKREQQALVDEPVKKKAPRADEPMELAPPPKTPYKEPEFDVGAVVELHRQWIASNGAQGAKANFEGMALSGVSLSGQNLAKANLRGTDLSNADLSNCVLLDADMRNAILSQALLNQAQMAGAKVRHADLQFAQLMETGLQGSDFAGADMRGAVLAGADLSGANLLGVDLRGADVMGINLTQKQLDRARGDHTTKLPPGLFVRMGEAIE